MFPSWKDQLGHSIKNETIKDTFHKNGNLEIEITIIWYIQADSISEIASPNKVKLQRH